jgi:fructan beta-fructosidase
MRQPFLALAAVMFAAASPAPPFCSNANAEEKPAVREMKATSRYLVLPVRNADPIRRVKVIVEGKTVREFDIKLALGAEVDHQVVSEIGPFAGQAMRVETTLPEGSKALDALTISEVHPATETTASETSRPVFHFTARRGWLNDPNGLVFHDGEYHLYFQHNPYGTDWGNMHWGHAVSPDLFNWVELGEAITPRRHGDWAFSGSAVVDTANTSGLGKDGQGPLVAAFTSTGRGECIVVSNDNGRTFVEVPENPVVKHRGRDPRLVWHEPTKRWVMAVYDEGEDGKAKDIAFFTSPNLRRWAYASRISGFFECPDLFEIGIEGQPDKSRWALYAADGEYLLGTFDGTTFTPDQPEKNRLWHGDFYAAQTFSNEPRGRRVQIGWGRNVTFPGMPFNQQMTVPVELTLRETDDGLRLHARPVTEIERLRRNGLESTPFALTEQPVKLGEGIDRAFDATIGLKVGTTGRVTVDAAGTAIVYDATAGSLQVGKHEAKLKRPADGEIDLRVLVDRGSVEVFAQGGRVAISSGAIAKETGITFAGDHAEVVRVAVFAIGRPGPPRP